MPTSRDKHAKRLMFRSQLQDLQMPKFVPKRPDPIDKEDELYPLKWPSYGSSDVQHRINNVLGPLSLFAPYSHEDEPEPEELELERPVTPINEEIKSQPTTFDKLASFVRRRIAAREDVPYLSTEDQQHLAAIIMGEVNHIWPEVRRQIDDPFLSPEENKELNRRIAVHIVTVCEKLFNHYLHKAQILNERGVFSGPANMSRLKAQLALDADKFLNVLTMRRYLVGDMRGYSRESTTELSRLHAAPPRPSPSKGGLKMLTHADMMQSSRPKSQTQQLKMKNLEQDLKEISEAMPYLDTDKLVDLIADLPDRGLRTPSDVMVRKELKKSLSKHRKNFLAAQRAERLKSERKVLPWVLAPIPTFSELEKRKRSQHHASADASDLCLTSDSTRDVDQGPPSRISEGESRMSGALIKDLASRSRVIMRRVKSEPVLYVGETLMEELGIDPKVRADPLVDNDLVILKQERTSMAKMKTTVVTKPKLGDLNFLSEDLKQLMQEKDETGLENGDDDLPPLLQAITRHHRHDDAKAKLDKQLAELEEKEKQRRQAETIDVHAPTHPQPATISSKVSSQMVVRTSDIRVSERVCLSSITLSRFATVYNDLIEEIDPVTVKNLDKNLFLSDEIQEVYKEIMKTVPSDHLQLDDDDMVVTAPESVNVAGTMSSSTLSKKRSQRVINPDLYHEKPPPWGQQEMKMWARTPTNPPKNFQGENIFSPITPNMDKIHEVMHNPSRMSQLMANTSNMPSFVADKMSRTYASWLQWWKSTVTGDDYMKYLSTLETDYMAVVFHFYDSEEGESDDEDTFPTRGHVSRRTLSSKATQEQRERERKMEELRAVKTEYKQGLWNVNSVLMGGLGKDPTLNDEVEDSSRSPKSLDTARLSAKTLQDRATMARQTKAVPTRRTLSRMSKATTAGYSEPVPASDAGDEEEEENNKEKQPQHRLETVWNSLQMPDALRLDMAIKYSCGEFFSKLTEAVERWEVASDLILQREALLVKLEQFERSASDPNRFFEKVKGVKRSSVVLLEEARYRAFLYKKIESVDEDIKQELDYIKSKFHDMVSFKGRPYEEKMKWDRVEMLHWLQEERKHSALRYESLTRQIPLPLKPTQLQPLNTTSTAAK